MKKLAGIRLLIIGNRSQYLDNLAVRLQAEAGIQTYWTDSDGQSPGLVIRHGIDAILINCGKNPAQNQVSYKRFRPEQVRVPIIVRSKCVSDTNEILALESGATDVVPAEMAPAVLIARICAHIRHHRVSGRERYRIGSLLLDPMGKTLSNPNTQEEIGLTNSETELLKYLCLAEGREVSFDEMKTEIWHYDPDSYSHTVSTHISKLRQKIATELHYKNVLIGTRTGYQIGSPIPDAG